MYFVLQTVCVFTSSVLSLGKPFISYGVFWNSDLCIGSIDPGIDGTAAVVTLQGSLRNQILLNTGLTRFCNNMQSKLLGYWFIWFFLWWLFIMCIDRTLQHRASLMSVMLLTDIYLPASCYGIEALMPSSWNWHFSKDLTYELALVWGKANASLYIWTYQSLSLVVVLDKRTISSWAKTEMAQEKQLYCILDFLRVYFQHLTSIHYFYYQSAV